MHIPTDYPASLDGIMRIQDGKKHKTPANAEARASIIPVSLKLHLFLDRRECVRVVSIFTKCRTLRIFVIATNRIGSIIHL